ncbi:hypothetical protein NCCP436_16730 [Pseudomonas sp. NCCP-436]|nr:hypothetical protein NCCP436_16730 [Pseudomonas sp. NCCP-436]
MPEGGAFVMSVDPSQVAGSANVWGTGLRVAINVKGHAPPSELWLTPVMLTEVLDQALGGGIGGWFLHLAGQPLVDLLAHLLA